MSELAIKTFLLHGSSPRLMNKLSADKRFEIVAALDINEFEHENYKNKRIRDYYFVINVDGCNREAVVFAGIFLRNYGYQVFITSMLDYDDFVELITDIDLHLKKEPGLKTELLITERATTKLGDISAIVKRFEAECL